MLLGHFSSSTITSLTFVGYDFNEWGGGNLYWMFIRMLPSLANCPWQNIQHFFVGLQGRQFALGQELFLSKNGAILRKFTHPLPPSSFPLLLLYLDGIQAILGQQCSPIRLINCRPLLSII